MVERDPDEVALTELLTSPTVSLGEQDRVLGAVIARAHRRVQRRRLSIVGGAMLVVVVVVAAIVVGRSGGQRVEVQSPHHLTAADVSFAVFQRPAVAADAMPNPPDSDHFAVDPAIGSRLAIKTATDRIYVFAARPSPAGSDEGYCIIDVRGASSAATCADADGFLSFGGLAEATVTRVNGMAVFGLVPDFVTRVSYGGRDVPIVNNAFVIDSAATLRGLVFSTPDGDKSPPVPAISSSTTTPTRSSTPLTLSVPGTSTAPTTTTTSRSTAPPSTARAVLAPASVPPVSDECSLPITRLEDGNVRPLLCPNGGVNTRAWTVYAETTLTSLPSTAPETMHLGPDATPDAVYAAMCSDYHTVFSTNPLTMAVEQLAAAYYGWTFSDSRITTFLAQDCPTP